MPLPAFPSSWASSLEPERQKPYFEALSRFVDEARSTGTVYPPDRDVFAALRATPLDGVRVVLLGQDPYHGAGQAHGLAFSVLPGVPLPPSLRNMFKELATDLQCPVPDHGCLVSWAKQGVLLLNTVLTVRAGEAHSHKGAGWETFTDAVIRAVDAGPSPAVFVLWGGAAKKKARLLRDPRHRILEGIHPSPLSAYQGFFGSRPYSAINRLLGELGKPPVTWCVPGEPPDLEAAP